jgi:hypothetical protein
MGHRLTLTLLFDTHAYLEYNHSRHLDSKSRKKCHSLTQVSIVRRVKNY